MKQQFWFSLLLVMGLAAPTVAHHSPSAGHDTTRLVTISGTISKVEWLNPHTTITLEVKKDDGQVSTERVEMAGPGALAKAGIDRSLFQVGQIVTVEAWPPIVLQPSTKGSFSGRTAILADGRRLDIHDRWGEPR